MVVGDHNGLGHARTNEAPGAIHHGEVNIESNFFTMVPAVAGDTEWKYHRTSRKVEDLRAVELNDVRRVFMVFTRLGPVTLTGFGVRTCRTNTSGQFLGYPFSLS